MRSDLRYWLVVGSCWVASAVRRSQLTATPRQPYFTRIPGASKPSEEAVEAFDVVAYVGVVASELMSAKRNKSRSSTSLVCPQSRLTRQPLLPTRRPTSTPAYQLLLLLAKYFTRIPGASEPDFVAEIELEV